MTGKDLTSLECYNTRDLLLLAQILHKNGLFTKQSILEATNLDEITEEWFTHKSSRLSRAMDSEDFSAKPTNEQLIKLYDNLISKYQAIDTTDLANKLYYGRIQELEDFINNSKVEFKRKLEE